MDLEWKVMKKILWHYTKNYENFETMLNYSLLQG